MNPPADYMEIRRDKLGEAKEGGPLFHCDLYDTDLVHKMAEAILPGLASACIDNTTGGLLKSPASVAVDIRREMVDYLIQRSENFVAESVVLEGGTDAEVSENPFDIISDFVDDFASSKRNFFSRVSGWVLSERREDRIDDLVQEMEINGFWLLNRRESVSQTLLKNIDFKNKFHCGMKLKSSEELEEHKSHCSFRTMTCISEGCDATISAAQMDNHDLICPFKILPCEQNCSDHIMRRDMDRHCITVCPMKLVKCPFYSVGCQSTVPHVKMDQHRSENLPSHLLCILQVIHKEASPDDLKGRVEELEKLSSPGKLAASRDARSLTVLVKDLEAKLGPMKVNPKANPSEEVADLTDQKQETPGLPTNEDSSMQSPSKKEQSVKSPSDSSHEKDKSVESPAYINEQLESQHEKEERKEESIKSSSDSFHEKDKSVESPAYLNEQLESQLEKEELKEESVKSPSDSSHKKDKSVESPAYMNEQLESQLEKEELKDKSVKSPSDSSNEKDQSVESRAYMNEQLELQLEKEELKEESVKSPSDSSNEKDKSVESPAYMNEQLESQLEKEELKKESVMSPSDSSNDKDQSVESPVYSNEQMGSQLEKEECIASVPVEEILKESPVQREEGLGSPTKVEAKIEKLSEDRLVESPMKNQLAASPKKKEEHQ
ncbi:TRAF-like superfamily protein [Abeliophyllum distichum]|uniref:TRAF-like superfamily protein n=1 Tax=Abeliophyllum distichum TaxID=126358 RepID=A0ABD1QW26_9LAMI